MAKPRILIVDDEPFNVDYLEQELEDTGCETLAAANGLEALQQVQAASPDLVLLDMMMPVMDGFETLSRLKADPATRQIPIIIISAHSDLHSVVRGIQLGAEDYLPKPFEPVLLHARISSCLEKKRLHDVQQMYLKSLERELEIARQIQAGFLPAELPRVEGWEIAAYFKAAREVAGDFYDAFRLPDGDLVCVTGDVCGKGVGAALFMTLFRSLIRATATTGTLSASAGPGGCSTVERLQQVAAFTNRYVVDNHGEASMFAAVFIASLDPREGRLTYLNCGGESPLLVRRGAPAAILRPGGPVIGVIPEARFTAGETRMEPGDLLLAYTDGVPDCQDPEGNFFGVERLLSLLAGPTPEASALVDRIERELRAYTAQAQQFDDITLLALKFSEC